MSAGCVLNVYCIALSVGLSGLGRNAGREGRRLLARDGMADAAAAPAEGGGGGGSDKRTPSEFLKNVLGRPVVVKLNSGVDYRGALRRSARTTLRLLPARATKLKRLPSLLRLRSGIVGGRCAILSE